VLKARRESAGFQNRGSGFRGVDLREQTFDLALREDFAFLTVWIGAAHGIARDYWIANSVK
jgi:hypothetical protein